MSYSINTLQKDADLMEKALKETDAWNLYPEAYKRQKKLLKGLKEDIETLKSKHDE